MRFRAALILVFGALALVVAGCGGEETAPVPEDVEGDVPTAVETNGDDGNGDDDGDDGNGDDGAAEGDEESGEQVFASAGCGGCHTFEEAGSTGTVGPSFDDTDTPMDEAVEVITNGRGAMPAFGDRLSDQEIRDVAAFVSDD